jgi:hypothetical protein
MEWGHDVATLVVVDRDTYFLRAAVKQFTREFEAQFAEKIEANSRDLAVFDPAEDILKKNFPYFTIQEESPGTDGESGDQMENREEAENTGN